MVTLLIKLNDTTQFFIIFYLIVGMYYVINVIKLNVQTIVEVYDFNVSKSRS